MDWLHSHLVNYNWVHTAHIIVDYPNIAFMIFLAAAPSIGRPTGHPWRFWVISAFSIMIPVELAELGKQYVVWRGHPSFPSGHESFGLAATVCLAFRSLRWLWISIPLCLVLAWALVNAFYHVPIDVAGAFLLGPPIAFVIQYAARGYLSPPTYPVPRDSL